MLTFPDPANRDLGTRSYYATVGTFHGMVAAMFGFEPALRHAITSQPHKTFDGLLKAEVTFYNLEGPAATVSPSEDLMPYDLFVTHLDMLAKRLDLTDDDRFHLHEKARQWIIEL